jgi:hypothetical protein
MGLLDRAKQLAHQAQEIRAGLQRGDILGGVGNRGTTTPTAPPPPGSGGGQVQAAASRAGVPDPLGLLSAEAVSQAAGAPARVSNAVASAEQLSVWWSTDNDWTIWLHIFVPNGAIASPGWAVQEMAKSPARPGNELEIPGADEARWLVEGDETSVLLRRQQVVADLGAQNDDVADPRPLLTALATTLGQALAQTVPPQPE